MSFIAALGLAQLGKQVGLILLNFVLANPGRIIELIRDATNKGITEITEEQWDALIDKWEIPAEKFFE